jgi:hypothetical protein
MKIDSNGTRRASVNAVGPEIHSTNKCKQGTAIPSGYDGCSQDFSFEYQWNGLMNANDQARRLPLTTRDGYPLPTGSSTPHFR